MSTVEIIQLVGVCVAVVTIVGFVYNSTSRQKEEIAQFKHELIKHLDEKVQQIYERINQLDSVAESRYTTKELCGVLHGGLKETMREVAADVKKLLGGDV